MPDIVLDIETDDLDATVVHIVCTRVLQSEERRTFTAENMSELGPYLSGFDRLWAHNGLSFDIPILNRLVGTGIDPARVRDTMIISQLLWPDRPDGHSLRSWGQRLGNAKGDFTDFSAGATEEAIAYCRQDVDLTYDVIMYLRREAYKMSPTADWKTSIDLEHRVRSVMNEVEATGFYLDQPSAAALVARLSTEVAELEQRILKDQPALPKLRRVVTPRYKKDGGMSSVGLRHFSDLSVVGGSHSLLDWQEFNINSRQQIGERLMRLGWKPRRRTETGQPQIDDEILSELPYPMAQDIGRYLMLEKRITAVTSWLEAAGPDSRVRCRYRTLGAVTNRMSCSSPNLQQVVGVRSAYGEDCRRVWTVPSGRRMFGTDLSGIEIRCLAHYMDDPSYTEEVLNGDIHSRTQELAGLPTRAAAKTFSFALIYGAGDKKLGSIVGGGAADGAALKERYLHSLPSFADLLKRVARDSEGGYLSNIDGRMIRIRHQHAALNSLLQSCAAVIAKMWLVKSYEKLAGIGQIVAMVHDELCVELLPGGSSDAAGSAVRAALKETENELGFKCPLDCEWKEGLTWLDVH